MSAVVVEVSQRLGEWASCSASDRSASFPFLPCSRMLRTCQVELMRGILHGCVLDRLRWQIQEPFYAFSSISESPEVEPFALKNEKNIPIFSRGNGNGFTFHTGRTSVNNVERSVLSTLATLDHCKMLLYSFQNKQFLMLAQGVFDKQAFVIIHYLLGKQLPCLYIYSTV